MNARPAARMRSTACAIRLPVRSPGSREENMSLRRQDLDLLDDISLQYLIHHIHPVQHLRENRVLVIETGIVDEIDENLAVAGVAPASGDADRAAHVWPRSDFIAHVGRIAHVLVRAWAAALDDEVRHDTMEAQPVVIAGL